MSISYDTNINEFEVNMFEYCTLMKDYTVGSKFACVKIHKLMPYCKKGKKFHQILYLLMIKNANQN